MVLKRDARGPAGRLPYLDGLRAGAALYVVIFHAVIGFARGELAGPWLLLKRASAFGHEAVAVFIVLSGYCLMLPVVAHGEPRLPRPLASFIGRRAFRILPPYYATLAASLLAIQLVPALRERSGTLWDDSLPAFARGPVLSHLLMLHNWFPEWVFQINGPLWSVATEWQIYFFFPLVLLPLWRRTGGLGTLSAALVLGYLPLLLAPERARLAIPWYLLLFAFGMLAAARRTAADDRGFQLCITSGRAAHALGAACLVWGWLFGAVWFRHKPITDVLVGLTTATLLVHLSHAADRGQPHRLLALLSSRPALSLGHFSYSLYLTHLPVLALVFLSVRELALSPAAHALCMLVLGASASLLVAYAFYWLVERHFVR